MTTPDDSELKHRLHVFVCDMLGLDDEDHENDEETKPIEAALYSLITARVTAELRSLKSVLLSDQDAMISNLTVRNIINRRINNLTQPQAGEGDADE